MFKVPLLIIQLYSVWESKEVVVFKRGKAGRGYAQIENPVFYNANTRMCFADLAKSMKTMRAMLTTDAAVCFINIALS